jgi:hypothetical protein
MSVLPKAIRTDLGGEFFEFEPEKDYKKKEEPGNVDWKGGSLPFIKSNSSHIAIQPLEASLENFLKHLWQKGQLNTNLPQRNFLAQTRVAAPPTFGPHLPPPNAVAPVLSPQVASLPGPDVQHLKGLARDWEGMLRLERVVAYTFRGDTRSPADMKAKYGGFNPPSMRNDDFYLHKNVYEGFADYMGRRGMKKPSLDDFKSALATGMSDPNTRKLFIEYSTWRLLLTQEEMHLGRMLASELFKGYISSSKAVTVAKGFAKMSKDGGYVYCLLLEGGYEVPDKGKDAWTKIFGEQEIAYPGSVPWAKVQGYRKVDPASGLFTGNVYLRVSLPTFDKEAAERVYKLLSGKVQKGDDS